jgi:glycosyltransferase involved in cell wall biosynthesis
VSGKKIVAHVGPLSGKGGMSKVMKLLIKYKHSEYDNIVLDTYLDSNNFLKIFNLIKLRKKIKTIISKSRPDLFHFHVTHNFSWWRKLLLIRIAVSKKIPVVVSIHSGKFDLFCETFFGIPGKIVSNLSKRDNIQIVVLEDRWVEKLEKHIKKIQVIRNPVVIKDIDISQSDYDIVKLLLIARNESIKGHDFAIDIAENIAKKGFKTSLAMTGIEKNNFKNDVAEIITYGWIENEKEIENLILEADFVLSPSKYEGSSMSILETMSLGRIPIVSNVSKETVGIDNLVVDNLDSDDWVEKIISIIQNQNLKQLQEEIYFQISKHEVSKIINEWKNLYDSLVNYKTKPQ